jgi:hypothetical protein
VSRVERGRGRPSASVGALSERQKWRAITVSTLVLVPAYLGIVAGVVAARSDRPDAPAPGPAIAFGLAFLPFVFVALAFLSGQPRAPSAVLKAMGWSLLVGIPVAALIPDLVTGLIAGIGAGGIPALRADLVDAWKGRAVAVVVISLYVIGMVRVLPDITLVLAPTLPFTALGIADHIVERRRERASASEAARGS